MLLNENNRSSEKSKYLLLTLHLLHAHVNIIVCSVAVAVAVIAVSPPCHSPWVPPVAVAYIRLYYVLCVCIVNCDAYSDDDDDDNTQYRLNNNNNQHIICFGVGQIALMENI